MSGIGLHTNLTTDKPRLCNSPVQGCFKYIFKRIFQLLGRVSSEGALLCLEHKILPCRRTNFTKQNNGGECVEWPCSCTDWTNQVEVWVRTPRHHILYKLIQLHVCLTAENYKANDLSLFFCQMQQSLRRGLHDNVWSEDVVVFS